MFQFTQPKRAATTRLGALSETCSGFNSRSPSGLRPSGSSKSSRMAGFNSRSPSGLRPPSTNHIVCSKKFQFTQPKRAATGLPHKRCVRLDVSIHAAQVGCDGCCKDTTKKEILSKDKSRKSLSVIILDEEDKAIGLELTDNQALRNSNKIMFTWGSQPKIFV